MRSKRSVVHRAFILILAGALLNVDVCVAQTPASRDRRSENDSELDSRYFETIYQNFYRTYKLGAGDDIAIRVLRQPDYTLEKVRVTPLGRIYHPLLGDVLVAGLTVDELAAKLTGELREYILDPKVSVALLEAVSAKIAVIGEVRRPGIIVMDSPMNIFDAINSAGGVTEFGSKTSVAIVRQLNDGRLQTTEFNYKRMLQGRSGAGETLPIRPGDTIVVNENSRRTFLYLTSLTGFAGLITLLGKR
jgi:protein involved in polysaccharide export with SLBB domain